MSILFSIYTLYLFTLDFGFMTPGGRRIWLCVCVCVPTYQLLICMFCTFKFANHAHTQLFAHWAAIQGEKSEYCANSKSKLTKQGLSVDDGASYARDAKCWFHVCANMLCAVQDKKLYARDCNSERDFAFQQGRFLHGYICALKSNHACNKTMFFWNNFFLIGVCGYMN